MTPQVGITAQGRWPAIRECLARVGADFTGLTGSVPPGAMATRDWTVAVTTAHVAATAALAAGLARGDAEPAFPELGDSVRVTTVDTVRDFNEETLGVFRERRVPEVNERLTAEIDGLLRATADANPDDTVEWLGGSQVTLAGLVAHLSNELLIHGRDIARATRRPWTIHPADAGHFVDAFLFAMTENGYGRVLDGGPAPRERRIAVRFRSAHTTPVTMVLHRGLVTLEKSRPDDDVRLTFDPTTLNLMLFGRVSKARAVATGRLRVGGPHPWLLPHFTRKVRLPS